MYELWDHLQEAHLEWMLEGFTEETSLTTNYGPDLEEAITEDDLADVYARDSKASSYNESLENEFEPANLKRLAMEASRAIGTTSVCTACCRESCINCLSNKHAFGSFCLHSLQYAPLHTFTKNNKI